jgi:hypothetical protein
MSFTIHSQHVDKALGRHYVRLHDPDSGAEHHLVIYLGHDACPTCGHVKPKTNTGELDFRAILAEELKNLTVSHAQSEQYAKKHGIPILRKDGTAR